MKIAALKERARHEARVAITPKVAALFIKAGFSIAVEKNIGVRAGFTDEEYKATGASVSAVPLEIIADSDIILKVQPSPIDDKYSELEFAKSGAIIIGFLSPYLYHDYIQELTRKNIIGIALELLPRIAKTQNMDALSSQSNLAGYRAVIEASYHFTKIFPMMTTAAGSILPCKILVIGAGIAGLQAIATSKRLGAIVAGYDVRFVTKEQIESLGAKFVSPELDKNMQDEFGYALESSDDYKIKQQNFLTEIIGNYDIIITTAQIPGKKAPVLITEKMLKLMKYGSVVVDVAAGSGGNVEGVKLDQVVIKNYITIIGYSNLSARIAADSSNLYAKNLYNFLNYALQDGKLNIKDDLIRNMIVTA